MKIGFVLMGVAAAASLASGCGSTRQALGLERTAPDEFRIITKAPLVMPPDYALRPPRPGEARPGDTLTSAQARAAVFGADIGADATNAEKVFVAKAGAAAVDPNIRTQVDFEGSAIVRKTDEYADKVLAQTPAPSTDEQEQIRRVTGGGAPTISSDVKTSKLPGL